MNNPTISEKGYYGNFGGMFLPELLVSPMQELTCAFQKISKTHKFQRQLNFLLKNYAGRPTPLTEIPHFAKAIQAPRIFLKREDLLHSGAHKINNALGQCLLAKQMGKTRVIAETGAGQHGVATATACAYLGLECIIYMGSTDIERQAPNVSKIKLLGAKVISIDIGSKTLKDAINAALRDYAENYPTTHYCIGSALGPHPYPEIVRSFQEIIGKETELQCKTIIGKDPDAIIACVGGGSNAIGIFAPFIVKKHIKLIGVEAGGNGRSLGKHAARFACGSPGVLHGCYSYLLQDINGQIANTHSISAGLDYPAVGPIHSHLYAIKRAKYVSATDNEALAAFKLLSQTEGIIPALESAHALGYLMKHAKYFAKNANIIVNLSGRGDKDLPTLIERGYL